MKDACGNASLVSHPYVQWTEACTILINIQGLAHMHSHNVLHMDIKPDNIFIDSQGVLKIGDFGLAVLCDVETTDTDDDFCSTDREGDRCYIAPEVLRGHGSYFSDIFRYAT